MVGPVWRSRSLSKARQEPQIFCHLAVGTSPKNSYFLLPAWEGTRERRCEGAIARILPQRARLPEQFTASGPLHLANSRRDPGFWLVHGSKTVPLKEPCSSPWCSEYCLTGEGGLRQGHLGTTEQILGSIGKRRKA